MSAAALAGRLVLAAVFGLAGIGKLSDRTAFRGALHSFGVPGRAVGAAVVVLPLLELVVLTLLLPTATARGGAIVALALLAIFCAAIARALVRGEHPDCACFGNVHSAPVGVKTLGRNASLAAIAALVAVEGPGKAVAVHVTPFGAAIAVTALGLLLNGWLSWQLLRQNGRLLDRVRALEKPETPPGLPIGEPAPDLDLGDDTLDDLLAPGSPLALVFSDPGCGACEQLAPRLEHMRETHAGSLEIAVVSGNHEALESYRIPVVPSATIIDADGRIASATATGLEAVERLLASMASAPLPERLRVAAG